MFGNTNELFAGFDGYISMISTVLGCFPDSVLNWLLAIFTASLGYALAKYLIDGL